MTSRTGEFSSTERHRDAVAIIVEMRRTNPTNAGFSSDAEIECISRRSSAPSPSINAGRHAAAGRDARYDRGKTARTGRQAGRQPASTNRGRRLTL